MERHGAIQKVQIFGTDIDDAAVAIARAARYSKMEGVSRERIERWFVRRRRRLLPGPGGPRDVHLLDPQRREGPAVLETRSDLVPESADLSRDRPAGSTDADVPLRVAAGGLSVSRPVGKHHAQDPTLCHARQEASNLPAPRELGRSAGFSDGHARRSRRSPGPASARDRPACSGLDRRRGPSRHGEIFSRLCGDRPAARHSAFLRRRRRTLSRTLAWHGEPQPVQYRSQGAAARGSGGRAAGAEDGRNGHDREHNDQDRGPEPLRKADRGATSARSSAASRRDAGSSRSRKRAASRQGCEGAGRRAASRHAGVGTGTADDQDPAARQHRRAGDCQRGDEIGQRGISVGQRGTAVLERGARNRQGGNAVGQ